MTTENTTTELADVLRELAQLRGTLEALRSELRRSTEAMVEALDDVARSAAGPRGEL